MANITADTPDPTGGTITRDKNGNPTGELYGHHAMELLRKFIAARPPELAREGIRKPQPLLVATGVTSFSDVYIRGLENVKAYREAGENGEMILRGAIYPFLEYPRELEAVLKLEPIKSPFMRFWVGSNFKSTGKRLLPIATNRMTVLHGISLTGNRKLSRKL